MWEVNYFEKIMYCWYDIQGNMDNQLECIRDMKVLLPGRRDELIRKILKRLVKEGYLLKDKSSYSIDDIFFKLWLVRRLRG